MNTIKKIISSILLVLLTVFCIVFVLQNGDVIQVNLFEWSTPALPIWGYVLSSFILGIFITVLLTSISSIKFRSKIRKQRKKIETLEKELHDMRNLPIDELPEDDGVEVATLVDKEDKENL